MAKRGNLPNYHPGCGVILILDNAVDKLDSASAHPPLLRHYREWAVEAMDNAFTAKRFGLEESDKTRLKVFVETARKSGLDFSKFNRSNGRFEKESHGHIEYLGYSEDTYEVVDVTPAPEVVASFDAAAEAAVQANIEQYAQAWFEAGMKDWEARKDELQSEIDSLVQEAVDFIKSEDWTQWSQSHLDTLSPGWEVDDLLRKAGLKNLPWDFSPEDLEEEEQEEQPQGFQSLADFFPA